jgi:DNA-binding Lrp family transcriptional regulator
MSDACIEHRYPQVLTFVHRFGADALVIVDNMASRAQLRDGRLEVETSVRQIADHLKVCSKDTVHRRIRQLTRARVISRITTASDPFHPPTYVLHLRDTGISVTTTSPVR